ncbi:MAG: hypothetical protein HUU50_04330 [Candidatus Brocadiae bacterium]|nr:hypothetical protein [Candidatus Brocadiia bacterium]
MYRNIKIWAAWNAQNKTILNWTPPESVGKNDFIALYEVVADNPNKYIIREWITNGVKSTEGYSYQSKREKGSDSWIAYVSYDYKQDMYIILAKEKIE